LLPPLSRITEAAHLNFREDARLLSRLAAADPDEKAIEDKEESAGEGALTAVTEKALGSPKK
jgi:hypothetical protein